LVAWHVNSPILNFGMNLAALLTDPERKAQVPMP
jgi:hypothetical protein